MKNKKLIRLVLSVMLCFTLSACKKQEYNIKIPDYQIEKTGESLRIAVASDLHTGAAVMGSISFEGNFAPEILDAFIADLKEEQVDMLVLCGDISNSSRYAQHNSLIAKLHQIEDEGIQVWVAPGNHDIDELKADEFADYYADFGYSQAISLDKNSLSYAAIIGDNLLVVLDTDGYTDYRYAQLGPNTLAWMQTMFEYANTNGLNIISVGHFPLITYQSTEFRGKEQAIELMRQYNVPLYLSGHLHGRSVNANDVTTELVVEQLTSYPCRYAILDIDGQGDIYYHPKMMNVSAWARASGQTDEVLLNFEELGRQSAEAGVKNLIETLSKKHYASPRDKKKRCEFYSMLSSCMSMGTVYANKDMLMSHPGYSVFMRICQDSNYAPWIPTVFEYANPYSSGFAIISGQLTEIKRDVD